MSEASDEYVAVIHPAVLRESLSLLMSRNAMLDWIMAGTNPDKPRIDRAERNRRIREQNRPTRRAKRWARAKWNHLAETWHFYRRPEDFYD